MFYKQPTIKKAGNKIIEEREVDKDKVLEEIAFLRAEQKKRIATMNAEYDVKVEELENLIK